MSIDPRRDPWRRLFNRNAAPDELEPEVAPAAAPVNPWERLMAGRGTNAIPQPARLPPPAVNPQLPAGTWTDVNMPGAYSRLGPIGGVQDPNRSPTLQRRMARFEALVRSGQINPRDIYDAGGRIRPDVWALLDEQPGYRGGAELGLAPDQAEWRNPAEVNEAQWERTFLSGLENQNVTRSGFYQDPVTGQRNVTAEYGGQLLDRFGTARAAEDQYRRAQEQARNAQIGPYDAFQNALEREQEVAREQVPGRANTIDEARLAAANRARQQAEMAYNRSRGVGRALAGNAPISVAQLGAGMTPEQLTAAGQAVAQGYTPEEMEEIRLGRAPRSMRTQPAENYYRALAAYRGPS